MNGRSHLLDAVRGAAILLVVCGHWFDLPFGWTGVDLFFVLSGYLISGILIDNKLSVNYYKVFYLRRMFRIFPMYCVFLLFVVPRFGTAYPLGFYLTFTQNLAYATFPGTPVYPGIPDGAAITWSLAVEEQFYMLLPLLVRITSPALLFRLSICCIAIAPIARLIVAGWWGHVMAAYVLLPCRLDPLFAGVVVAILVRKRGPEALNLTAAKWAAVMATASSLVVVAAFSTCYSKGNFSWTSPLMWTLGYSALAMAFASTLFSFVTLNVPVWPWHPLRLVGIGAYSIYFLHPFMPKPDGRLADGAAAAWILSATLLAAFALTSWIVIERPLISFARRRWRYADAVRHP